MPDEETDPEIKLLAEGIQASVNVSDKFQGANNGIVTKWIVIAEVAASEGVSLIFRAPEHMRPWDIEGMLGFVYNHAEFRERGYDE